jgi:Cu-Zn family superoxide dismutase
MKALLILALAGAAATSHALDVAIQTVTADGTTAPIGSINLTQTQYGVVLTPALHGLPPGAHGFHLHEKASCEPGVKDGKPGAALGAGGHFDPNHTGHHEGPYAEGHLGDLPALFVNADGTASQPMLAPRLKLGDFPGHALVIHAGGDNNADQPAPLGGGGPRIACGVVAAQ